MNQSVQPIPAGFEGATPYLNIKGAASAIEFYKQVFDATVVRCFHGPNGNIFHAEIKIGQAHIFLTEEMLEWGARSPTTIGGTATTTVLYFADVDAIAAKAQAAGATFTMPVADMFWGDRSGSFIDPFGHSWMISTHKEELTDEELSQRAAEAFSQGCDAPHESPADR